MLVADVTEGTVLDVGCGPAPPVRDLLARGVGYVGVDLSATVVHLAARRLDGAGPGRCHLLVADARALPFADRSFDLVVCTAVLGLLTARARRAALFEMARVCRGEVRLLEPVARHDRRTPRVRNRLVGLAVDGPLIRADFESAGLVAGVTGPPCVVGVYSPVRAAPPA